MAAMADAASVASSAATLKLFLQSMAIGLSIAAPVGQIGVLAIQRTLQHGRAAGLATGLGAAFADAVYGAVGAFGVSTVIAFLVASKPYFAGFGAVFLLWLAWRIARQPALPPQAGSAPPQRLAGYLGSTFLLTLSNPGTILSFIAIFGALAGRLQAVASPWVMVGGVLLGSALWWLLLAAVVGALRQRFDARWQRRVNGLSAALLTGFAVWQLATLLGAA
jgi:threonine/homoserine/homoserine lactone efflux protein